jgi:hypothetical protein
MFIVVFLPPKFKELVYGTPTVAVDDLGPELCIHEFGNQVLTLFVEISHSLNTKTNVSISSFTR